MNKQILVSHLLQWFQDISRTDTKEKLLADVNFLPFSDDGVH